MFNRILIANRGEIALRIIRACRELGVQTVAVYSEADKNALYLKYADEAVCIGPAPSADSYLSVSRIISAAEVTDVDAIHPGYGFLAENSHFAEVCESCKIKFIGPSSEALSQLGNKPYARKLAMENKVPVIPGSKGSIDDEKEAVKLAHKIGYPVILKASSGGGGRGMRVAHNDVTLVKCFHAARSEADISFKDPSIYMEKYLENPRHIEVQILADDHGSCIHLGERDCSIQRRHQKVLEEAPSPIISAQMREDMGKAAIRIAKAAKYSGAGTVEFLVAKKKFYFIEMNARVQVEHPVSEMVTGVDIVKEQIKVASGERLKIRQRDIKIKGASIECRINAEDPDNDFKPTPGIIKLFNPPGGLGVRVDSHVYSGYAIPPNYDSLIAKLIVYAADRKEAVTRMRRALDEFVVEGCKTTIPLHLKILGHPKFARGTFDTSFIEEVLGTT